MGSALLGRGRTARRGGRNFALRQVENPCMVYPKSLAPSPGSLPRSSPQAVEGIAPAGVSLARAREEAAKGRSFSVDSATASKLVKLIPPDLLGLSSQVLVLGKNGWTARNASGRGDAFVEAALPGE